MAAGTEQLPLSFIELIIQIDSFEIKILTPCPLSESSSGWIPTPAQKFERQ